MGKLKIWQNTGFNRKINTICRFYFSWHDYVLFYRGVTVLQFNIKNYSLGSKLFSIAHNQDALEKLRGKGLNTAHLFGPSLMFYPEKESFPLTCKNLEKLSICENYDVLYVNEQGDGWVQFANEKDDNPLILTQRCNSNCLMCPTSVSVRKKENALCIDYNIELIKYIPSDAKHLTITGGEPFLVGDRIFDLFNEIKNRLPDTDCLLLTNGRALGYIPYADRLLLCAPKRLIVGVPLHGYNSDTHNRITQTAGSFDQTVSGIKNLLFRGFNVEIRIVVSKLNCQFISRIADLIINEFPHVGSVKIMGLEMLGSAAKYAEDIWIPYDVAFEYSKIGIINLINRGIDVGLYNFPLCAVDNNFHLLCQKSITDYKIRFTEKCDDCKKKQNCGGIFAGTIRFAKNNVMPWR
ncbi:MAG: His-Xaa-Ser system radical SAM maturase HxsC [Clostridia bacterium]|nr:His-Xaa-Ser system radical SAM maturase HxsC [Clostridia bacterium]